MTAPAHAAPIPLPSDAELDALPLIEVVPSFTVATHGTLSSEAAACSRELVAAQWYQDSLFPLVSAAHFDNCAFEDGRTYVQDRLAEGRAAGREGDLEGAAFAVGRALHGVQDFYAHSNYVELGEAAGIPLQRLAILPVWDPTDTGLDALLGKGLISGTWVSTGGCKAGNPTHGELNKDSAARGSHGGETTRWGGTYFEASYALARRATAALLAEAWRTTPGLEGWCGPVVAVEVEGDERRP